MNTHMNVPAVLVALRDCLPSRASAAGVVLAFGVPLELRTIEVHLAQIARAVAERLVVEVARRGVAALAARTDGPRLHGVCLRS